MRREGCERWRGRGRACRPSRIPRLSREELPLEGSRDLALGGGSAQMRRKQTISKGCATAVTTAMASLSRNRSGRQDAGSTQKASQTWKCPTWVVISEYDVPGSVPDSVTKEALVCEGTAAFWVKPSTPEGNAVTLKSAHRAEGAPRLGMRQKRGYRDTRSSAHPIFRDFFFFKCLSHVVCSVEVCEKGAPRTRWEP